MLSLVIWRLLKAAHHVKLVGLGLLVFVQQHLLCTVWQSYGGQSTRGSLWVRVLGAFSKCCSSHHSSGSGSAGRLSRPPGIDSSITSASLGGAAPAGSARRQCTCRRRGHGSHATLLNQPGGCGAQPSRCTGPPLPGRCWEGVPCAPRTAAPPACACSRNTRGSCREGVVVVNAGAGVSARVSGRGRSPPLLARREPRPSPAAAPHRSGADWSASWMRPRISLYSSS